MVFVIGCKFPRFSDSTGKDISIDSFSRIALISRCSISLAKI